MSKQQLLGKDFTPSKICAICYLLFGVEFQKNIKKHVLEHNECTAGKERSPPERKTLVFEWKGFTFSKKENKWWTGIFTYIFGLNLLRKCR